MLEVTSSLFPTINKLGRSPATSVITRRGSSQLILLHLPLKRFTNHAVKPDIGSQSQFLPTPPAFDVPVQGVPVRILPHRLVSKS